MKMFITVILILVLMIVAVGIYIYRTPEVGDILNPIPDLPYDEIFSEESYQELTALFEDLEDELSLVVYVLQADDTLNSLERFSINFLSKDEFYHVCSRVQGNLIIMHEGEIPEEFNPLELVEIVKNNTELYDVIRNISKRGILSSLGMSSREGGTLSFSFSIRPQYLSFITEDIQAYVNSWFTYYSQEDYTPSERRRHIGGNWYMDIATRG